MNPVDVTGVVFGIQRFSVDDGPGIRTTVFVKGCNLRCRWCHNPESIDPRPILAYTADRCVHCGKCAEVCPAVHTVDAGGHQIERQHCRACGACVAACSYQALALVGEAMTAGAVMEKVLRDRRYYRDTGGLTLSGGEPLMQPAFAEALLTLAKDAGIATAVETNGAMDLELYRRLLPLTDLFLWDIKDTDDATHRRYTGHGLDRVLGNLRALDAEGGRFILRCPLIPGVNDRPDHLENVRRLALSLGGVRQVQIMPYHRLARGKAVRYGLPEAEEYEPPSAETLAAWTEALAATGKGVPAGKN